MDIFKHFKKTVQIRDIQRDNEVFQLHYRVTAILLVGCAALVASKQHFGDPIDCITRDDVPNKIMDTYCWIHATFTLPSACNKTVGIEVPHPCIDQYNYDKEDRVYHKYYQWVYFVLFFQAACFYAPHMLWKAWESNLLQKLTGSFKSPLATGSELKDREQKTKLVLNYLTRHRSQHMGYFYRFAFCEALNFVNVIIQIYVVNEFLGGTFTTYGLDVINYVQMDQDERMDPMVRIFPRMTKCTFHRFGASGDVQRHDALCILPLNIINEKIYIVMWFWFMLLAIVTGAWLIYRLATFLKLGVRLRVLERRANFVSETKLRNMLKRIDSGDWFLLSMMCKNMDSQHFREIVVSLIRNIQAADEKKMELEDEESLIA